MGYLDHDALDRAMAFARTQAKNNDFLAAYGDLAARGDDDALFSLGCAFSTGSHGIGCDMIEAHKWFNLAAARGHEDASNCRAEVAEEMTAREIAEAQRRARAWLKEARARH